MDANGPESDEAPPVACRRAAAETSPSRWWLAGRALVGFVLVGWLARGVDWTQLGTALAACRLEWCAAAWLAYVGSQTVSVYRWAGLGRTVGFDLRPSQYWIYYFQGMFLSLCLPSSIGGDFYKAWRLGRDQNQYALAMGSVLADRAAGLAALGCLACGAGLAQAFGQGEIGMLAWVAALTILACGLCVPACLIADRTLRRLGKMSRLREAADKLTPFFRRPQALAVAILWSLPVQVLSVASVMCLGLALGLNVPPLGYFLVVPSVALATVLPLSINGIGIREGGLVVGLAPFGVPQGSALVLGLLWFGVVLGSGLLGAIVLLVDSSSKRVPAPADEVAVPGTLPSLGSPARSAVPAPKLLRRRRAGKDVPA